MKFKYLSFKMIVLISNQPNIIKFFNNTMLFFNSLGSSLKLNDNDDKFMDTKTTTCLKNPIINNKKGTAMKQFLFYLY